jgi:hypothetical protein
MLSKHPGRVESFVRPAAASYLAAASASVSSAVCASQTCCPAGVRGERPQNRRVNDRHHHQRLQKLSYLDFMGWNYNRSDKKHGLFGGSLIAESWTVNLS